MIWASSKGRRVLAALCRIGWGIRARKGTSHKVLVREGWPHYVFPFGDDEEIGPRMLARIAKHTGLRPRDI
ncbi:type II toxin-antitoxin system HicA family toxin [Fundidesulfovibrio magnetotacticus]|uniref:type II toxin-antitoxin system HicA family toxin n=1 Tax=Fundidesulfovibrio magnetotacticus TaxID=2730080 RepID=UPI00156682C3|nr:type II toxin-antitoxin system HicA family toxin [Fundidesulfovibrio magnetotacticus]